MGTVHKINQARRYEPIDHRRKVSKEDELAIVEMRSEGHTHKEIGARFGITGSASCQICMKHLEPERWEKVQEKRKQAQISRRVRSKKCGRIDKKYTRKATVNREYMKRRRAARKSVLWKIKSAPCMDCGGSFHPCAMHFDHRPDTEKRFNIGERFVGVGEDVLMEEIAKCDIVCANCHALRTYERRERGF